MGASEKELCVVFLTNDTSYRCHAMAGKFLVPLQKKTEKQIPGKFLVPLQKNRKKNSCHLLKILAWMDQS